MAVKFVNKEDILREVLILEIVEEFNITLESIASGNFNQRCRCPSINHKDGMEKTPSLYIDSVNNNFYCYGCSASHNCIDFYMLCSNTSFTEAFSILKARVKNPSNNKIEITSTQDNLPIILELSNLFRETILANPKDLKWVNKLMQQTDKYLEDIPKEDLKSAQALLNKVKKYIKEYPTK